MLGYKDKTSGVSIILNGLDKLIGLGGMLALICCNTVVIIKARSIHIRRSTLLTAQKLTVVAVAVMGVFVLSVLPYFLIKIIYHTNRRLLEVPINPWFRRAIISSYYLMHVSSTINPVLYVLQGCGVYTSMRKLRASLVNIESPMMTAVGKFRRITLTQRRVSTQTMSAANCVGSPPESKIILDQGKKKEVRLRCTSRELFIESGVDIQLHNLCVTRDWESPSICNRSC